MAYYVHELKDPEMFGNHYHIFRAMEGIIDIRNDYWYTKFYLYSSGYFNLPLNSILATYILPYQEIEGIPFNLCVDQDRLKHFEATNYLDCHIYEASHAINVANNPLLKSLLNNAQIRWQINFEIDPTPLSHVQHDITQEDLDSLINETSKMSHSFDMYYTNNYRFDDKHSKWNITNRYELQLDGTVKKHDNLISAIVNDYSKNKLPITLLATLKSNKQFQIIDIKIKFVYKVIGDEDNEKTFEFNSYATEKDSYEANVYFDIKTLYDHTNKKVNNAIDGIKGFYIPKFSSGYYQINFNLYQDFNVASCVLINPFCFDVNNDFPKVLVTPIEIKSLEGYTFKKF